MAWISLFNGDNNHKSLRRRWQVNTFDVRHTGLLHAVPNRRGAQAGTIHAVNRRFEWRGAADDRIVAVVKSFDANERFGSPSAGVITGPFAERTFLHRFAGNDFALDDEFRARWKMQSG